MKLIERSYLKDLAELSGSPDIKVITGLRRAGKSKLMEAFISLKKETEPDSNIIHINFNIDEFEELKEYRKLNDYVKEHHVEGKINYLLIDEVQLCNGFENAINWLHASEKYDIYITGSNAFLLSSDLATFFTGRTMELQIFPFSMSEYATYRNLSESEPDKILTDYIADGGMAGSYLYSDINMRHIYVNDVFKALIVRDIKQKYKIRNIMILDKLVDFMMDNIGCEVSTRSIVRSLNSANTKVNDKTLGSYLSYLCNAFLFYRVRRFDIQGKKYLNTQDKYYLCDHSFRQAKLGSKNLNTGRILENIVAVELLRRGYELYTGVLQNKEIDFVAIKRNEKLYIQVSENISYEDTFRREYEPLLKIKDAYPKIILARTNQSDYTYEGIMIKDVATWLLNI